MPLRMATVALILVLFSPLIRSQSAPPQPTTSTLEAVKISNAVYPSQAREQKIQGRVVATMLVSESGDVETVKVFKADEILSQSAAETIKQWKFKPVTRNGTAVPVVAKVTFDFVLDNEGQQGIAPDVAPATDFPQHVRVSETVMQGFIVRKVSPEYPASARANNVHGAVTLSVVIRKDGTVGEVQVVSGPAELTAAAVDAARQWQYRPYQLLGRAVEIETTLQFIFR